MKNVGIALAVVTALVAVLAYIGSSQVDPCVRRDELYSEYSRPMTPFELQQRYKTYSERIRARERGGIGFFEDEMPENVLRQYRTAEYECRRSMQP